MTLEQILELWEVDSKINPTNLSGESLQISQYHNKYYKILVYEKMKFHKMVAESKELKLEKYEFFTQGPSSKEQIDKGWRLPAAGKILKSEVQQYMEADKDIIATNLKISLQQEKINLLEAIINSLNKRSFDIKNAIADLQFKNGGY